MLIFVPKIVAVELDLGRADSLITVGRRRTATAVYDGNSVIMKDSAMNSNPLAANSSGGLSETAGDRGIRLSTVRQPPSLTENRNGNLVGSDGGSEVVVEGDASWVFRVT